MQTGTVLQNTESARGKKQTNKQPPNTNTAPAPPNKNREKKYSNN